MSLDLHQLQQKHPKFTYDSFQYQLKDNQLNISWLFILEPGIKFTPTLTIPLQDDEVSKLQDKQALENLIFNLGLVEMISYWKVACPPEIVINAGYLDSQQIDWWENLIIKGLGEFFYTNKIDFTADNFVTIKYSPNKNITPFTRSAIHDTRFIIIPIGGGKDSIVTAQLLKEITPKPQLWSLNPIPASFATAQNAGYPQLRTANRTIDPQLLELNKQGYLNGHTPFSAYLAFFYALVGWLVGSTMIALSNEQSANEANTTYHDMQINHQYSKSFKFETNFRQYSQQYLLTNLEYFSFLRPLHELQIAQLFTQFPQHFSSFRSCNAGQKQGIWCHHCSKCLFAFLIIFPFVENEQIVGDIFESNLFDNDDLIETAFKLVKPDLDKPFDCVGSYQESKIAFYLAIKKYQQHNKKLTPMLEQINQQVLIKEQNLDQQVEQLLNDWNEDNYLTEKLDIILKEAINN